MVMQEVRRHELQADVGVRLELTPTTTSPLAIDVAESPEMRIQRLISENPVIVFSRSSCCMCHAMKRLLSKVGAHPTVIELDEDEIAAVDGSGAPSPALYIGGTSVGGLENVVALHLSGDLELKLKEVGALTNMVF
ncbi:Glutaredoxin-C6 [Abeliophyllum distichum]|uniref:Glutaredoxin-C6 n=1 Tax=Abeliophyllum distichum TaxID=126358 RepID=A0ABD1Q756_9LAMI